MEQNNKNKEQKSFKIFDKVLVRNSDEHKWRKALLRDPTKAAHLQWILEHRNA